MFIIQAVNLNVTANELSNCTIIANRPSRPVVKLIVQKMQMVVNKQIYLTSQLNRSITYNNIAIAYIKSGR